MPSGKRSKQQRRATPPPVRSTGGGSSFGGSRRTWLIVVVVVLVLAGLGVGLDLALGSSGSSTSGSNGTLAPLSTLGHLASPGPLGAAGPEEPPIESGANLAPAGSPQPGQSVDGIQCQGGEQVAFHHHARLTVFVNGQPRKVPFGVGIADPVLQPGLGIPFVGGGACFSWLHTHAADGIIHIESPVQRAFTLGNFFDVWGQPLSTTQVGPAKGNVTALYKGKVWLGDPRDIPLHEHSQIQLEVGRPLVGPVNISSSGGL